MLILNRRRNERIILSGGITLTVLELTGGSVSLGIEAPRSVHIAREELLGRKPRGRVRFPSLSIRLNPEP